MSITKERLLEIEQELNGLTISKMVRQAHIKNVRESTRGYASIHKCPHCNRSGNVVIRRHHFDNCALKGVNLEEFNKDLLNRTTNLNKIAIKYNLDRGYVERYLHRLEVNNS